MILKQADKTEQFLLFEGITDPESWLRFDIVSTAGIPIMREGIWIDSCNAGGDPILPPDQMRELAAWLIKTADILDPQIRLDSGSMETRQDQFVRAETIAKELCISQRWIVQEARAGRLPHIKVEHDFLFDLTTVKHLLKIRATKV